MINSDEELEKLMQLVSAGNSSLRMRLDVYLDYYGKALKYWRINNVSQYKDELNKAKERFENGVPNSEVEMLAMIKVDYEMSIANKEPVSAFTTSLNSYKEKNNENIIDILGK